MSETPDNPPEPVTPAAPEPVTPAVPEPVTPAVPEPIISAAPEQMTPAAPETGLGAPEALTSGPAGPEQPARSARVRRAAAVALPVLLVLGAVGGAAFHIKSEADKADTTVATDRWGKQAEPGKDPAGDIDRGRHDTELSQLLLPVPGGHRLGPEGDEYGNDVEMSGKEATALMKSAATGLTGKDRRRFLKLIDRQGIEGVAGRSYASFGGDIVYTVHISKMKDRRAIKDMHSFNIEDFGEAPGVKKGPKIDGHKSAKCFMLPTERKNGVDGAYCSAYTEDLLVQVEVFGVKKLAKDDVAWFVKDQLDHIESPGEYV
ncbi:hypothetical protein [Streptomyces sp. KLOTTS4A1]|uniref:hypothetical protein n=1 Tax=Streptomyces sp. KLOTTS4A1 TaxID=3390996 RepID=UPI0039F4A74A